MVQSVVVLPQPDIQLTLPVYQTCLQDLTIEPVLQPSSALGFDWYLDGTMISNLVAPSINVQGVGTHTISVDASNQYGCQGGDMAMLEISAIPVADFVMNSGSGCLPLMVSATNLSTGATNFVWQLGGQQFSTFDLDFQMESPNNFDVSLVALNDAGCSDTMYSNDTYSAYPVPYVEIAYTPEEIYDYQGAVRFNDVGSGSSVWFWEMGDGNLGYTNEYYHSYDFVGEYIVTLEGTNEFGCVARDSAVVNVKRDFEIFVPSAFTPKSYDGVNDYFKPIIRGKELVLQYKFTVTNRWGDLLFETNDMDAAWNGAMDNSPDYFVQNDTYIWMVSVELLTESTSKTLQGTVLIIR
jgi:gliding motility-associated-like protein